MLTTARYYTPSGRSIQGRGIMPDVLVANSVEYVQHFDPQHEAELNHAISNTDGTPDVGEPHRADLPTALAAIPNKPPRGFPEFDPSKSETDFQLQQALIVARAMVAARKSAGP